MLWHAQVVSEGGCYTPHRSCDGWSMAGPYVTVHTKIIIFHAGWINREAFL
jgi:hypothetical protein